MNYAPTSTVGGPVCEPGEFRFASMALDHGHIYGMTAGLVNAGATLAKVYDPDTEKAKRLAEQYGAEVAASEKEILEDDSIQLVAAAAVPNLRGPLGLKVQDHDKHYFTDKTPFTELAHLEAARAKQRETGKKWAVCYSERVQNEAAVYAGQLVHDGVIGRVIQVLGLGPHRLNADKRPAWFFKREEYGGILCDIGSHQIEQFLSYTGNTGAVAVTRAVARALVVAPRVLMLDEPSAGLSPKLVGQVFEKLVEIREGGVTIVLVEQNVKAALAIADRGVILVEGKERVVGEARTLMDDPAVAALYLGRSGRLAGEGAR